MEIAHGAHDDGSNEPPVVRGKVVVLDEPAPEEILHHMNTVFSELGGPFRTDDCTWHFSNMWPEVFIPRTGCQRVQNSPLPLSGYPAADWAVIEVHVRVIDRWSRAFKGEKIIRYDDENLPASTTEPEFYPTDEVVNYVLGLLRRQ